VKGSEEERGVGEGEKGRREGRRRGEGEDGRRRKGGGKGKE